MDSLADEPIRQLHGQFLDAAKTYPDLFFAAATPLHPERTLWPVTIVGHASQLILPDPKIDLKGTGFLGLPPGEWCELIDRLYPVYELVPLDERWLQIQDQLWQGAFYDGTAREHGAKLREDPAALHQRATHGQAGIELLDQLARQVTFHFSMLQAPTVKVRSGGGWLAGLAMRDLERQENRWLEALCSMPFVKARDSDKNRKWEKYRLRRLPGDAFTASALAIEALLSGPTNVAPQRAKPEQSEGCGGSTTLLTGTSEGEIMAGDRKPPLAGDAFLKAIQDDPIAQQGLSRVKAKLMAWQAGLKVLSRVQEEVENSPEILNVKAELRNAVAELVEFDRQWQQTYGEPFPRDIDDWKRLAVRAGLSADYVRQGKWTGDDVMAIIEGWLLRKKDIADSAKLPILTNSDASAALPANQEKGEIMASLQDERLASLYRQFLRAAEQFPFVRCAAVRRSDGQGRVSVEEWCGLLGAPRGCSHIGCGALVLIDGEAWEAGCYLTHGDYDPSPERIASINVAIAEVERLSRTAASCFGFRPSPSQPPQPQLGIEWEWLRAVLDMPFVHKWDRLGLSVREIPDDFFTASARAIEELAARQSVPPTAKTKQAETTIIARPATSSPAAAIAPTVDFMILTALEEEREALLALLPGYRRVAPTNEDVRVYFEAQLPTTGLFGPQCTYRIIVVSPLGMGRVHATTVAGDAIRRWRPRYMLLVGVAGGVSSSGVNLGDLIVANPVVDYELQKLTGAEPEIRWNSHQVDSRLLAAAQHFSADKCLPLMKRTRPDDGKPVRHIGPVASGDKVIACEEVLKQYKKGWPKLLGVEMEAGGAASAAFQTPDRPGFFMVRAVSDLADADKNSPKIAGWRTYACDLAAAYAVALLQDGPVPPLEATGNVGSTLSTAKPEQGEGTGRADLGGPAVGGRVMEEQGYIDQARSWLQARFLEATEKTKSHDVIQVHEPGGISRPAREDEKYYLTVRRQELHDYLISIGAPVAATIDMCQAAGWITVREGGIDFRELHSFYGIMPAVVATSMPPGTNPNYGGAGRDSKGEIMSDAANSLLSNETAVLCDDFVRHVGDYLEWEKMVNLTAQTHKPGSLGGQALEEFGARLVEFDRRKNEEAFWLRENGPALAAALERRGFKSSEVLQIVHCAGRSGGGPAYILPKWEETKVALQRAAIQLRGNESRDGSQAQGKRFRVALSFPGEHRHFVVQIADILAERIERRRVFYDKFYEAELARPNLDTYLQQIYHDDSDLIAVFLCVEYEKKDWCGLEWRAIRDLIKKRDSAVIMPFRFDATTIPGLFSIDGYVEIGKRSPNEVASLILERLEHNDHRKPGTR